MRKSQATIQFDPDVLTQAKDVARQEQRSLANMVTILVREALEHRDKRSKKGVLDD